VGDEQIEIQQPGAVIQPVWQEFTTEKVNLNLEFTVHPRSIVDLSKGW
jgi:hypothetical protein